MANKENRGRQPQRQPQRQQQQGDRSRQQEQQGGTRQPGEMDWNQDRDRNR